MIVKTQDAWPVRAGIISREAMTGCDGGFEMKGTNAFASCRKSKVACALLDEPGIPGTSVLFMQAQQVASIISACCKP